MKLVYSALAIALLSANAAFAKIYPLTIATNDEDSRVVKLALVLNSRSDITGFKVDSYEGEKLVESERFGTESSKRGIVIEKRRGRNVVTLLSSNFSEHQGGNITLRYLYNGVTGSTRREEFELERHGDQWKLFIDGRQVRRLHFVSNRKFMVGTIGVKAIRFIE